MSDSPYHLTRMAQDVKYRHIENIARRFLSNTRAIDLERDLVQFLLDLDKNYNDEVEVEVLKRIVKNFENTKDTFR